MGDQAAQPAQQAADAKAKLEGANGKLNEEQQKLTDASGKASEFNEQRCRLAEKVKDASHISIPENSSIEDAHGILEQAKGKVESATKELLSVIAKEKEAIKKKHEAQKAVQ